ncbi:BBE domain-containing protein [Vibrio coralliilyticus]|uniref:BBE domain-containing protein n=1 Tax=Vibrio coralliilyticus TaxID=190893 RepID=UPI0018489875|nr:BBE domain-containing protein [Vibrio coralliilyticus]NUW69803.1 BBE domain-containing protein [Vibrio coralliilyticus]
MELDRRNALKLIANSAALASLPISFSSLSAEQVENATLYGFISVTPDEHQFEGLTVAFNQRWSASNCEVIYFCLTAEGVRNALQHVINNNQYRNAFSVKSGGHCYENFVFNDGIKAIIDVSYLKDGGYDTDIGYYAETGLTNWEANKLFYKQHGKCIPGGTCYSVGLGGHIAGGGYGALSRLFGLTIDLLTGVEMATVDADGNVSLNIHQLSDGGDSENLAWACAGGGGGNFGIITKYIFSELPDAPQYSYLTRIAINWSDITNEDTFKSIIQTFEDSIKDWPNHMYCAANVAHMNNSVIDFDIIGSFDSEFIGSDIYNHIDDFFNALESLGVNPYSTNGPGNGIQRLNWLDAVEVRGAIVGGSCGKYKSCYMRKDFPDSHISSFYEYLTQDIKDTADNDVAFFALIQLHTYGGAINNLDPDDTPSPQRDSQIKIQYLISWKNMYQGSEGWENACVDWINNCYASVYSDYQNGEPDRRFDPDGSADPIVDGCYIGYVDVDLQNWQYLYYGDNYFRLQLTKAYWDPNNYFNHAQSIELPIPT